MPSAPAPWEQQDRHTVKMLSFTDRQKMGETCGQVIHVRPLGQNEDTQSKRPGTDDRKLCPLTFKYTEFTEKEKLGSWAHSEPRNERAEACSVLAL